MAGVTEAPLVQSRNVRLRVGIVGLGRLWEARHRPALCRLSDRFRIVALYDQVARRAAVEAQALGCVAAEGLTALVDRRDIDAFYFLTPQWFGNHALEMAARSGRPIYSALPLAGDPDSIQSLEAALRSHGTPVVPELARRFYPATLRLRELLASRLGPPRVVVGHTRFFGYDRYGPPGPTSQVAPLPISVDPGANLLDWCRFVFDADPDTIQGYGTVTLPGGATMDREADEDFGGFVLHFPGEALAQISYGRYHRPQWGDATSFLPPSGFQVYAEKGVAWLEMPDRIQWTDTNGTHEERLPLEPSLGETLNEQFHRLVRGDQSLSPTLDDALAAARLVHALRLSRTESRCIRLNHLTTP